MSAEILPKSEPPSMIDFGSCQSVKDIYDRIGQMEQLGQTLQSDSGNYSGSQLRDLVRQAVKAFNNKLQDKIVMFHESDINFVPRAGNLRQTLYEKLTNGVAIRDVSGYTAEDAARGQNI